MVGVTSAVSASEITWTPQQFLGNISDGNISSGDIITISSGEANVDKNYTINVENIKIIGNKTVTFKANASNSFFNITGSNIIISGIKFSNFKDSSAIYWSNGTKGVIDNCEFFNCTSTEYGGALHLYKYNNGLITNCLFTNCTSGVYGGAIDFYNSTDSSVLNSTFNNCVSKSAGAISLSGDNGVIDNCVFNYCNGLYGGAVAFCSANARVTNCDFTNCSSKNGTGGAIIVLGSKNTAIEDCVFTSCSADIGGAVAFTKFVYGDKVNLSSDNCKLINNKFMHCKAIKYNGAIVYNDGLNLTISGLGCTLYNNGTISSPITVTLVDNKTVKVFKGDDYRVTARVQCSGYYIISPDFTFIINGEKINCKPSGSYYAIEYNINGSIGDKILVNGIYTYASNITYKTGILNVSEYKLNASDVTKAYKNGTQYTVKVTDVDGNPIANKAVNVTVSCAKWAKSPSYTITSDENGTATLIIGLAIGEYSVKAELNDCTVNNDIIVLKNSFVLEASDLRKFFDDKTPYTVKLSDKNGNLIANEAVNVYLSSPSWSSTSHYKITTNSEGVATLPITLNPGTYTIKATADTASKINAIDIIKVTYKMDSKSFQKYYKNNTQYTVKVTNLNGEPVVNATVTVTLNSASWKKAVSYKVTTNEEGVATLKIGLVAGTYTATANLGGNTVKTTIKVLPRLTASGFTKKVNQPATLKAKVVDETGKPIYGGYPVNFYVNGKEYCRSTDSNGIASLPINLCPAIWTIPILDPITGETVTVVVKVTY